MSIFKDEAEHFDRRMRDIYFDYKDDEKVCYNKMIDFMCETLEKFGCDEGVKTFRETHKYYS